VKTRPQTAWVAVVKPQYADKAESKNLRGFPWLGRNRAELMLHVNEHALYPHEFTAVRVHLTPATRAGSAVALD
jgi:hypothetical protein